MMKRAATSSSSNQAYFHACSDVLVIYSAIYEKFCGHGNGHVVVASRRPHAGASLRQLHLPQQCLVMGLAGEALYSQAMN
jgi:hypothetical protein